MSVLLNSLTLSSLEKKNLELQQLKVILCINNMSLL